MMDSLLYDCGSYNRHDKRTKLPKWILDCMGTNHLDLSVGDAMDKGVVPCVSCDKRLPPVSL
jgi:hypothetical protein